MKQQNLKLEKSTFVLLSSIACTSSKSASKSFFFPFHRSLLFSPKTVPNSVPRSAGAQQPAKTIPKSTCTAAEQSTEAAATAKDATKDLERTQTEDEAGKPKNEPTQVLTISSDAPKDEGTSF
ncbi:hypothetical protein L596_017599 [Steinernema carpocapsae]|uniref:Uncharacterized protein n=1 Tax=Steinernema carpocapsae TaxID=34508 RepID=A0A4U5N255_STECR|nr:hypothetical protein L596_017599 [Steinernema carpocapsae]